MEPVSYQPKVGDTVLLFIDGLAAGKKVLAEIREVDSHEGQDRVAYFDEDKQKKVLVYAARAVVCGRTGSRPPYSWDVPLQYGN